MRLVTHHKKHFFRNIYCKCFPGRWVHRGNGTLFVIDHADSRSDPESTAFCPLPHMDNILMIFKDTRYHGIGYCLGYVSQQKVILLDPELSEDDIDEELFLLLRGGVPVEQALEFICL